MTSASLAYGAGIAHGSSRSSYVAWISAGLVGTVIGIALGVWLAGRFVR